MLLADRGLTSPKLIKLARQRGWDYVLRVQSETTLRTAPRGARLARLDELVPWPGAPNVFIEGWVFAKYTTRVHIAAVWCLSYKEPWLLVSNLDLGRGLVQLYAQRMQVEASSLQGQLSMLDRELREAEGKVKSLNWERNNVRQRLEAATGKVNSIEDEPALDFAGHTGSGSRSDISARTSIIIPGQTDQ